MESMHEKWQRLRSVVRRDAMESGLDEEIRFHIEQQTTKNIRAGMDPVEARRQAMIRFGGVAEVKERTRDEFRPALAEDLLRDLRYGVRVLGRAPTFAFVSILTLGLGIGAATAVFSVVNGVLLAPLPYPEPDRVVRLVQIDSAGARNTNVSEPNFVDWKEGTRSFRAMAQMSAGASPVGIGRETSMIVGAAVSREFFDVMGVGPVAGRGFVAAEQSDGGSRAAIIGDAFWRSRFLAAPLETLSLRINDQVHQVVGVMPAGFDYPSGSQFWIPRELSPPQTARTAHNWQVVARLADGTSLIAAQTDLSALSRRLKTQYGDATWMSDATAIRLRDQLTATVRPVLWMLFGAAVLLLVIACLNVSNLQLARASTRRREMAVRLAIGAGRGRITRQLLAEAAVLSLVAAAVALAIALGGVRALVRLQPANLPRIQNVQIDWMVMLFAAGVALATSTILGIATAARLSHQEIRDTLNEGARTMAGGRTRERVRQGLVVAQVALTIVLLAGAGLLSRSFVQLLAVDPGYHTDRGLLLDLSWAFSLDPAVRLRRVNAQRDILSGLRRLPEVENVGLISAFPLGSGNFPNGQFLEMTRPDEIQSFEDRAKVLDESKSRSGFAGFRIASEGYFQAMGIRLVRGRLFDDRDGPDQPHVAIVSESLAAAKWPNQDPLGRYVQFGNMDGDLRGFRIVGIVSDVREISPETAPGALFYGYHQQRMVSRFTVVVRTRPGTASDVAARARQVVSAADPTLPIQIRSVGEAFDRALAGRRFSLTLIVVFSVAALILATLGIYGLISYLVAERTREIGIRLALGAESGDVLRMVIGQGTVLAAAGIAVGLSAALGLGQLMEGMLFGITATDPIAFAGVLTLTFVAVLVASYIPARRALRVAPVVALRAE